MVSQGTGVQQKTVIFIHPSIHPPCCTGRWCQFSLLSSRLGQVHIGKTACTQPVDSDGYTGHRRRGFKRRRSRNLVESRKWRNEYGGITNVMESKSSGSDLNSRIMVTSCNLLGGRHQGWISWNLMTLGSLQNPPRIHNCGAFKWITRNPYCRLVIRVRCIAGVATIYCRSSSNATDVGVADQSEVGVL
jgi:hypothetical protein